VSAPRRLVLLVAIVAVVLGVTAVALRGCEEDEPPRTGAARLMPRDALVYLHLSTDGDRAAVQRASELLDGFGLWRRQRDAVLQRLAGTEQPVDVDRDIAPWLGDEAAVALVDAGTGTAGSVVAVAVNDEDRARQFLERNPRRSAVREHRGDQVQEFGEIAAAVKDGFLLIGQDATVNAALDRTRGQGESIEQDETFRRAGSDLPEGRVAHAYASAAGLRRLLVPQGDLVGSLAVLLDQPALQGVSLTFEAVDGGARITTRSALDTDLAGRGQARLRVFEPGLLEAVPSEGTVAYLGVSGISGTLGNLVATAAGGADAAGAGQLLGRLRQELDRQAGGNLERDLLSLLEGEVAVVVGRAIPAPTLTLVTAVEDEGRTRQVLERLQRPLAELMTPEGEQAPSWSEEDLGDGVRGSTLTVPGGAALTYAVAEGRLIVGTGPDAVRRIKDAEEPLGDAEAFGQVVDDRPDQVTSIGFLDFSQLLELGEQTGLTESQAYLRARDDLRRIRAVGVSSTGSEGATTAEILLSIP
jgi:hypothetical protein